MVKNQYGKTWWGQQFLQSLNAIDYDNRLPRGRSYANNGSVISLSINENHIVAKVSGSRPKPYQVEIVIPPFFDPQAANFINNIADKPTIISKLLNRELDAEVLEIALKNNLKIFPQKWTDFKMQCNCPDWAVPCKHIAAVIYKVSSEIDNDPFLSLKLHKIDLINKLEEKGLFIQAQNNSIPLISDLIYDPQKYKITNFNIDNLNRKVSFSRLNNIYDSLIKFLGDEPPFYPGKGDFKDKYCKILNKLIKSTIKIINGSQSFETLFPSSHKTTIQIDTHSILELIIDADFDSEIVFAEHSYDVIDFIRQISKIPVSRINDYQPSVACMHIFYHSAINIISTGAIVPQIYLRKDKQYAIRWLPATISSGVRDVISRLETIIPEDLFYFEKDKYLYPANIFLPENILSVFITKIVNFLSEIDYSDIYLRLFFESFPYSFQNPGEESNAGSIKAWLEKFYLTQGEYKPKLLIKENNAKSFELSISILSKSNDETFPLTEILNLEIHNKKRYIILQKLTQISKFIPELDKYVNDGAKTGINIDFENFAPFLMTVVPVLSLLDIDVLLPNSLKHILKPKPTIKIKKAKNKSFIGLNDIFEFDWQIALGNDVIDEEEFTKLISTSKGLIKYKESFIYVDENEIQKLYKHFTDSKKVSSFQLFKSAITGEYHGSKVAITKEVSEIIKSLNNIENIEIPITLNANLRPYQKRGYSWMYRNSKIGFGSLLADDMGLGKTLQVITTLLKFKEEGLLQNQKVLIVAPTGLLSNWEAELHRFAPELKATIYHGSQRKNNVNATYDILITSYGVLRSDSADLKKKKWHCLVIDEAQNIKNNSTDQSKAVKSIFANNYIAMSGTPVENRLMEMWSIMDFSNHGYLGSQKEFSETFVTPIEQKNDEETAELLKKTIAPFMMRRLKSDKTIISDLPDKIEIDTLASLSKEQAILYKETLAKAMESIEGINDFDSKSLFVKQGLVLQMILALKQICNHPANFLKNKSDKPELSGKLLLLFDLLENIIDNGEKVLIFTQFAEMGNLLQKFIKDRFEEAPMFYHGGCNTKQRNDMVSRFQTNRADRIFILSLKAAGTGLNLTAANHVIHYDLWWNPAVETQATDRAYRIGQTKNVMVHRLICQNTFEEKINKIIQQKKHLANMTVEVGETWIGDLSNKELRQLFEISSK